MAHQIGARIPDVDQREALAIDRAVVALVVAPRDGGLVVAFGSAARRVRLVAGASVGGSGLHLSLLVDWRLDLRRDVGRGRGSGGDHDEAGDRRAHALLFGVAHRRAVDVVVGVGDGGHDVLQRRRLGGQPGAQEVHGECAGHLSRAMAAHPVGDDEQLGVGEEVVLVPGTDPPRVRRRAPAQLGHQVILDRGLTVLPGRCSRTARGHRGAANGRRSGGCRCGTTRSSTRGPRPSPAPRRRRCGRGAGRRRCRR